MCNDTIDTVELLEVPIAIYYFSTVTVCISYCYSITMIKQYLKRLTIQLYVVLTVGTGLVNIVIFRFVS